MTAFLLDVNVLIALLWPAHEAHAAVQEWFRRHAREGWATCPLTQAGFVRIVSNPAFSPDAVTPWEAANLLNSNSRHPAHRFWPDEISYVDAVRPMRGGLRRHRQVSDAYLLGLAIFKKGKLATLDRSVLALVAETGRERAPVALIQ